VFSRKSLKLKESEFSEYAFLVGTGLEEVHASLRNKAISQAKQEGWDRKNWGTKQECAKLADACALVHTQLKAEGYSLGLDSLEKVYRALQRARKYKVTVVD
jgi:hypothetical protein